ncbi:hypothetical protein MASR1M107_29920 [Ignavibacteriales bacterium]
MNTIKEYSFSIEHIQSISMKYGIDKQLVQKQIASLVLVAHLKAAGLEFIFKGGTSLLCLITPPQRLSLDVDIVVSKETDVEIILNTVAGQFPFTRFEKENRGSTENIIKFHYRFFFNSFINPQIEENILLDILFEDNPYSQVRFSAIPFDFILTDKSPIVIVTPTIESILGDKLTAFAPNTTGIPYKRGERVMSMEIIKQLYDIAQLFDRCENFEEVKSTFFKISRIEMIYRKNLSITESDVLNDIYLTSFIILQRDARDKEFVELLSGINRLKSYILNKNFHLDYAIIAAGKAAYISRLLLNQHTNIERFMKPESVSKLKIADGRYLKFNKLHKSNPEAFFYWFKTFEIN